jgi:transposase-like protein
VIEELEETFDLEELEIACPHCGRGHLREVLWLRSHASVDCDGCGRSFSVDKDTVICAIADLAIAPGGQTRH